MDERVDAGEEERVFRCADVGGGGLDGADWVGPLGDQPPAAIRMNSTRSPGFRSEPDHSDFRRATSFSSMRRVAAGSSRKWTSDSMVEGSGTSRRSPLIVMRMGCESGLDW